MGMSLEKYADVIFQRERILDMDSVVIKQVKRGWFKGHIETVIEGDLESAWSSLKAYAETQKVPFVAGDLERTNRVPELEQLLQVEPLARREFRRAYAEILARHATGGSPHAPMTPAEEAIARALMRNEDYMGNPFLPVAQRKPGLIQKLSHGVANT